VNFDSDKRSSDEHEGRIKLVCCFTKDALLCAITTKLGYERTREVRSCLVVAPCNLLVTMAVDMFQLQKQKIGETLGVRCRIKLNYQSAAFLLRKCFLEQTHTKLVKLMFGRIPAEFLVPHNVIDKYQYIFAK
jgi:hypothetical protein